MNPNTGKLYDADWFSSLAYGYSDNELKEFYKWIAVWDDEVFSWKQKEFQNQFQLSNEEMYILNRFTGQVYHNLNTGAINPNKRDGVYLASIQFILNALKKITPSEWKIWRWHKIFNENEKNFFENISVGDIYENPHFFSSSKEKNVAIHFMNENPTKYWAVLFEIETKKARNIAPISNIYYEKEYIFMPKQLFTIEKIENNGIITIITIKDL